MTIDEAIRHCEEVAENYRYQRDDAADINDVGTASDCQQCADEHEQLASWLTELKEAKRLLKTAVEDMNSNNICYICYDINACNVCTENKKCPCDTFKWRYTDEALKLIGGETDEKP